MLQTNYKNHRIQVNSGTKSTVFDIYSKSSFDPISNRMVGSLHMAASFVINDFGEQEALNRAKQLIDSGFETPILAAIRRIPRWA